MTSPLPAHHRQFDELGAHLAQQSGQRGVYFGVWAPHARTVAVVGDFNGWQPAPLSPAHDGSGRWTGFVAGAQAGDCYKYRIETADGQFLDKADPFALCSESPPRTASRVWSLDHTWHDAEWMEKRAACQSGAQPISIYEVHLGSWQRADDGAFLNYRELAQRLAAHCQALNFTHVELMPVAEHPFYGSWGYQITGYFAPTSRYGSPQDLMDLVDTLHQHGIGVLLDWVPSHFPSDAHGLATFDGTALYEHPDTRRGFQPQWKSLVFNYGRFEVRDFLISNAIFWLEKYHFDGLRVDAVASMLYLDFAREPGQWVPNPDGGNENFDATTFMRALNTAVGAAFPGVHMVAEESSSWAGVSRPVDVGGLGFGMKWNMGWMNDLLRYTARPHFFREHHGDDIRFSIWYAFNENFVLPLSHDEVVHGKYSLLQKQPGDEWQRFAGLRVVYGLMWAHPGKKLLFMGGEFAQVREWNHDSALDWHLWDQPLHAGIARWVADLNAVYRKVPALHRRDFDSDGFAWAGAENDDPTIVCFFRRTGAVQADEASGAVPGAVVADDATVLTVCNFTPAPHTSWRIGVPHGGRWYELLNGDATQYGGSGVGNLGGCDAEPVPSGGHAFSMCINVPPLAAVLFSDRAFAH